MASRRMFSKDVVCSDRFLDMPASAQALYFQYGLEADDDGFVSAPKKILRLTNASDDDLKILVAKGFLIPFDSGVVVIRDWKINNYLRRDRYTPTRFKEEFEQLDTIDDRYQLHVLAVGIPDDNHVVDMRDTQVRLGKDSIGKGSINNNVGRKCLILLRQLLKKYRSIALNVEMLLMLNHLLTFTHLRDGMLGKQK